MLQTRRCGDAVRFGEIDNITCIFFLLLLLPKLCQSNNASREQGDSTRIRPVSNSSPGTAIRQQDPTCCRTATPLPPSNSSSGTAIRPVVEPPRRSHLRRPRRRALSTSADHLGYIPARGRRSGRETEDRASSPSPRRVLTRPSRPRRNLSAPAPSTTSRPGLWSLRR